MPLNHLQQTTPPINERIWICVSQANFKSAVFIGGNFQIRNIDVIRKGHGKAAGFKTNRENYSIMISVIKTYRYSRAFHFGINVPVFSWYITNRSAGYKLI